MCEIINFETYRIKKMEKELPYHPVLDKIRKELSPEDYMDFVEGCLEISAYHELDPELLDLVDTYWDLIE